MPERARETSGTMTSLVVQYVRRVAGEGAVDDVVARSGVGAAVEALEDEAGWFTYEDKLALWSAAAEVLGDPHVSRHMGETVLDTRVGAPLRLLLRGFGSPRMVLSNVAKVCPKFSTVATMRAVEHSRRHIVVTYELHEGYRPHRLDCEANIGLMSAAGPLFGLPLLDVEHVECQVQGAPRCVYIVRWPLRRRVRFLRRKRLHLEEQVEALATRVESMQEIATDLVSFDDKRDVLARVITRAGNAVSAQRYLLAVRTRDGGPIEVHHDGFTDAAARSLGEELLREDAPDADPSRIVIDVVSSRRHYGRLAAFYDGHPFFEHERQQLAAYARSAAAALDAATALDEARERGETAAALLELARRLAKLSQPAEVGQQVAEAIGPVLGADCAFVFLNDLEHGAYVVRGDEGWTREQRAFLRHLVVPHDADTPISDWTAAPAPMTVDRSTPSELGRAVFEMLDVYGVAVAPIRRHDALFGVAVAGYRERLPDDVELVLGRCAAIADQAATAIENARLLEQVRHQATHDDLTGLPNRVLFEDAARRALHHSTRSCEPVSLLFVDLDGFKAVNDEYGHDAGDVLLAEVARRLECGLRAGDVVARIGGDEFTVLLPGATAAVAAEVAERLRNSLESPIALAHGAVRVSACVGIGVAPEDATDYKQLLRAADTAMYAAKRDGRNRCVRYEAA
jgi:diguanylate cyclase (GGDEF)-like protein